jgi:phosphatidylglycerol:prolipoprotein diacylglycerol transferase
LGVLFPYARRVRVSDPGAARVIEELGLELPADQMLVNLPRHPSQLYEAFGEGILLFLLLWFVVRPRKPYPGFSVAIYVIGYSSVRFVVEYFRELDAGFDFYTPLNLSLGQLFCLAGIAGGTAALLYFRHRNAGRPKVETFTD